MRKTEKYYLDFIYISRVANYRNYCCMSWNKEKNDYDKFIDKHITFRIEVGDFWGECKVHFGEGLQVCSYEYTGWCSHLKCLQKASMIKCYEYIHENYEKLWGLINKD